MLYTAILYLMARALVSWRPGSQLATPLVATLNIIITFLSPGLFSPSSILEQNSRTDGGTHRHLALYDFVCLCITVYAYV